MSEIISVYRGTTGTDVDGNAVQGELALVGQFAAHVAPNHPSEPNAVGRTAVITGYTIYIRAAAPTGIKDTDVIDVRGTKCPVDGLVAAWRSATGAYKGEQFAVKVVTG